MEFLAVGVMVVTLWNILILASNYKFINLYA